MHPFPDYKGGRDRKIHFQGFIAININDLDIYPHLVQSYNDEYMTLTLEYVLYAMQDISLRKALRSVADGYIIVADNQLKTLQPQRT